MNSIEIDKLKQKMEKESLNIIDIRAPYEYINGKIPTAINIDKILLTAMPERYLDKQKTYYIYCQSGYSSGNLAVKLNRLGYNVINITGGYNNYLLTK